MDTVVEVACILSFLVLIY